MILYHVFLRDYKAKKKMLLGILPERRKIPRGKTPTETGLKWAKKVFGHVINDPQAIFVGVQDRKGVEDGLH